MTLRVMIEQYGETRFHGRVEYGAHSMEMVADSFGGIVDDIMRAYLTMTAAPVPDAPPAADWPSPEQAEPLGIEAPGTAPARRVRRK